MGMVIPPPRGGTFVKEVAEILLRTVPSHTGYGRSFGGIAKVKEEYAIYIAYQQVETLYRRDAYIMANWKSQY